MHITKCSLCLGASFLLWSLCTQMLPHLHQTVFRGRDAIAHRLLCLGSDQQHCRVRLAPSTSCQRYALTFIHKYAPRTAKSCVPQIASSSQPTSTRNAIRNRKHTGCLNGTPLSGTRSWRRIACASSSISNSPTHATRKWRRSDLWMVDQQFFLVRCANMRC